MSVKARKSFELGFAEAIGAAHAFAFWKGRVALFAILRAMGIGPDDEVVIPGYTCVMVVNPILYLRAKPVYADIDPITFNIDPAHLESLIGPRTRAIIAQHTYGFPAAMSEIMSIAEQRGIPVIEDCCLALGSRYNGRLVGTFGAAAYWSFQWNKPFTTGIGGMATTNDKTLARKISEQCDSELIAPSRWQTVVLAAQVLAHRALVYPTTTALIQSIYRRLTRAGLVIGSSSTDEFMPEQDAQFFKGMGNAQARAGLRRLRHLPKTIAHRRELTRLYDSLLAEADWPLARIPDCMDPSLVRYPVRVADKRRAIAEAASRFVELGTWFETPLHPAETNLDVYGYTNGMCPVAEEACRQVVNLPVHPRATARTARRTVDYICSIGPASPSKTS